MGKDKYHNKHEHFDIIVKDYARGSLSKVSIIRRRYDGKLFIWKQSLLDDDWHHTFLRKEIRYSKYWRKFGISKVESCWYSDKRSLLKTYIKGKTLECMLKEGSLRFSVEDQSLKALKKFFGLLIGSKRYVGDLTKKNLVFDGKMWHVIDSGSIGDEESHSRVRQKYKIKFLENWSQKLSSKEVNRLKLLIDSTKPIKFQK